jgi:hypothetical protein
MAAVQLQHPVAVQLYNMAVRLFFKMAPGRLLQPATHLCLKYWGADLAVQFPLMAAASDKQDMELSARPLLLQQHRRDA